MLEVQAAQFANHQGPGTCANALPERLLEDSDGVVRLYYCDEVVAECSGRVECDKFKHPKATWLRWRIERFNWKRAAAFKMLQGATLAQLVGHRYIVTGAKMRNFYDPRPGVDHIELCELIEASGSLSRTTFFELVHSMRTLPPGRPG
jgi:hypothetical protein